MIQLNTTAGQYTSLDGPYKAVEEGSLSFVPVGDRGILVYIGGDVPSIQDGINATMSSNPWSYVLSA
ncbi:Kelch-type beta propeller [Penicillium digitatum]|uniref:Kelch-type beta propeller n=1 Tax=Penicillium digitatum TaxID=36651 RepID=A0A7T6XTM3_PENDI|nr:Kelch-type beta propeller [Penicillium digitatum]